MQTESVSDFPQTASNETFEKIVADDETMQTKSLTVFVLKLHQTKRWRGARNLPLILVQTLQKTQSDNAKFPCDKNINKNTCIIEMLFQIRRLVISS